VPFGLVTTHGRVLPFGDARFYGDMSRVHLNGPVIGSVATTTGHGYSLIASDGASSRSVTPISTARWAATS